MADSMNGSVKYVVSGTLKSADWQNSTLIPRDRAAGQIAALKHQPGKNIGMTGSAALVSWLLRRGLLDELHLLVFPVVLGSGKRRFGDGDGGDGGGDGGDGGGGGGGGGGGEQLPLKLTGSATFETGVVHLTYARA